MIQQLPHQLRYNKVPPMGFPSLFKQFQVDPTTTNKTWVTNDIVRFNFSNGSQGVFDPYRSYIQLTVSVDAQNTIGLLQLDNSSHSFIRDLVIWSGDNQVQRIQEYSVIAAYLNDIGYNQFFSQGRQQQGFGYGSFDTMPFEKKSTHTCFPFNQLDSVFQSNPSFCSGSPTIYPTQPDGFIKQSAYDRGDNYLAMLGVKGHVTSTNPILNSTMVNNQTQRKILWQKAYQQRGFFNNLRAQYVSMFKKNNFIQGTNSRPSFGLQLHPNVFIQGGFDPTSATFNYPQNSGSIVYQTTVPTTFQQTFLTRNGAITKAQQFTTSNFGFTNLFSPALTRGTFQPIISQTVRYGMMYNGKILSTKQPLYRRKLIIPLMSGSMGIGLSPSQYCLLPLQGIQRVRMQITLDPYAMFTSGYKDICQLDVQGMSQQQKRSWQIDRIQYKMHTYHFLDNQIKGYIQASLYKQITLITSFWTLGNQFQIPGGQGPTNSYIVGHSSKHLSQIVCLFNSNDYQVYSFCRKHYRLSNNITKFQTKIGVQYWPSQPYRGHAGNPFSNQMENDNSKFVENIMLSNNLMFNSSAPMPKINIYNFALNQRPYNVQNRSTFYPADLPNSLSYQFNASSINCDTAMGLPHIHENRCIGKAAFVVDFSPFSDAQNLQRGIDVSGVSNFQVLFQSQNSQPYANDQTLYLFCKSSAQITIGHSYMLSKR